MSSAELNRNSEHGVVEGELCSGHSVTLVQDAGD